MENSSDAPNSMDAAEWWFCEFEYSVFMQEVNVRWMHEWVNQKETLLDHAVQWLLMFNMCQCSQGTKLAHLYLPTYLKSVPSASHHRLCLTIPVSLPLLINCYLVLIYWKHKSLSFVFKMFLGFCLSGATWTPNLISYHCPHWLHANDTRLLWLLPINQKSSGLGTFAQAAPSVHDAHIAPLLQLA